MWARAKVCKDVVKNGKLEHYWKLVEALSEGQYTCVIRRKVSGTVHDFGLGLDPSPLGRVLPGQYYCRCLCTTINL